MYFPTCLKRIFLVLFVLSSSSSVFAGSNPFVCGVTTKAQVIDLLGKPQSVTKYYSLNDISYRWGGKEDLYPRSITLHFDADDILKETPEVDSLPPLVFNLPGSPLSGKPLESVGEGGAYVFKFSDGRFLSYSEPEVKVSWLGHASIRFTTENGTGHDLEAVKLEIQFVSKIQTPMCLPDGRISTFTNLPNVPTGMRTVWTVNIADSNRPEPAKQIGAIKFRLVSLRARMNEADIDAFVKKCNEEKDAREKQKEEARIKADAEAEQRRKEAEAQAKVDAENQKRAAAKEAARRSEKKKQRDALKNSPQAAQRRAFARVMETRFLDAGINCDVTTVGDADDELRIKWVLASKVTAHQINKSDLVSTARSLGFKRIRLTDGYDFGWVWTL